MITNICYYLQGTQIKLENVRAKNRQGNAHTLRFLLLPQMCWDPPGNGVSRGQVQAH